MSINSENESFPLPMIKNQKSKIGIRDVVGQIFRMIVDNVSEASIELLSTVFDKTKTAGLLMYNKNNPKSILFQTVDMGNGYKLEYTNKQMLSMQLFVGGETCIYSEVECRGHRFYDCGSDFYNFSSSCYGLRSKCQNYRGRSIYQFSFVCFYKVRLVWVQLRPHW